MPFRVYFLFLVLALFPQALYASCGNVDLREPFGEIRNQDSVGWCHAFVTADLISYYTGKRFSAADAAIQRFNANADEFLNENKIADGYKSLEEGAFGEYTEKTLQTALEEGICLEEDFSSEDQIYVDAYMCGHFTLNDILRSFDRLHTNPKALAKDADLFCRAVKAAAVFQPNFDFAHAYQLMEQEKNPFLRFFFAMKKNCDGKRIKAKVPGTVKKESADRHDKRSLQKTFALVDSLLAKKHPLILSMDSDFITDESKYGSETGPHALLIVGSRKNKDGSCEYLLRNSWGRACESYAEKYVKCDEGNLWIKQEDIGAHINGVVHVAP